MASDDEYDRDVEKLFLEKITSLDKNVILVPCFPHSNVIEYDFMPTTMWDLSCENASWYTDMDIYKLIAHYTENPANISGHFCEEMNQIVFQIILKKIQTGIWDCRFDRPTKLKYQFDELYRKKEK